MLAMQRNLATTFALTTVLLLGGCKSSTPTAPPNDAASQAAPAAPPPADQAASNAAAPAATPSTAPTHGPAATPEPAPAAAAPAPAPVHVTAPTGAHVSVVISQQLSAKTSEVGQPFSGELAAPLTSSSGKTVLPKGTPVEGTVTAAKGRGKFKGEGNLAIELTSIGGHAVTTDSYLKTEKGKGKRTAGMVGGGAGAGALIGGLAGGGKGALIGGLVGAGAGTAGAALTGNKDIVIPAESVVTFTLQAPLTITK